MIGALQLLSDLIAAVGLEQMRVRSPGSESSREWMAAVYGVARAASATTSVTDVVAAGAVIGMMRRIDATESMPATSVEVG
jgi:hypothetical protein